MKIDVLLYPQSSVGPNLNDKKVVVLDILRATSTILTALANRAVEVIPVIEPSEVVDLVKSIGAAECVTGGERRGFKIEGLELGNSPAEYTEDKVAGKKVILCTTNGTKAIKWAQSASELIVGSYLNIQAVVDYLKDSTQDVVIVCSGREQNLSMEDLACAGMIIQMLEQRCPNLELTDAATVARIIAEKSVLASLTQFIKETEHGRYLIENGMEPDIAVCTILNQFSIVPKYSNGRVSLN